jgi:starch synthase
MDPPINNAKDYEEKEKQALDKFDKESDQMARIKALVSYVLKAYSQLTDESAKNQLLKVITELEEQIGGSSTPEESKELIRVIKDGAESIKKNVEALNQMKASLLQSLQRIQSKTMELAGKGQLYDESNGFFWVSEDGQDNVSRMTRNKGSAKEIVKSLDELKAQVKELEKYLTADENYFNTLQSIKSFEAIIYAHAKEILAIEEQRQDTEHSREFLSDKNLTIELNRQVNRIYYDFLKMKTKVEQLIQAVDSKIMSLEKEHGLFVDKLSRLKGALASHRGQDNKDNGELPDIYHDSGKLRTLMMTHEYTGEGGVATVTRKLTKYLKKDFDVDVIERSIRQGEIGLFRYYLNSTEHPNFEFRDMSHFFNKYPSLKLSLAHTQSINFAPGENHFNNGGLDEIKNIYKGIPVICTCHSFVLYEQTLKNEMWMPYSIKCQEQTINLSDKFIVLHNFGKQLMMRYYPQVKEENIFIIPNGVELHSHFFEALENVEKTSERVFSPRSIKILYVGRISREKGLTELIQALPHIAHKYPQVQLLIAGDHTKAADYYKALANEIRQSRCADKVSWLGYIKEEEQAEKVYRQYKPDIAILPSHHESFPLFAIEAISYGVPLIVTDCDGPREIYSPFRVTASADGSRQQQSIEYIENPPPGINRPLAIAVDPKNHQSIINSVFWTLEHPREVHAIMKNAMHEVRAKYNWAVIASETSKLYTSCIKGEKFISPYQETRLSEELFEMGKRESGIRKDNAKIGIIGHFNNPDGSTPDGVARWDETVFSYLRKQKYSVEGYAFVGGERDGYNGTVHFSDPKLIAGRIAESDIDVALIHAAAEHANNIIDACKDKGVSTILVLPYWGVWEGTFNLARKVDILITVTDDYATKLRAKTGRECRFVPFPIDTDFWSPGNSDFIEQLKPKHWPRKTFNIAYVGRLGTSKMVHKLIRPFKELMIDKGYNEARLIIGGVSEGNSAQLLKKEIIDNQLQDYVAYHERQFNSEEVREIYRSCDAFIFASSFETYGQSNLEAISCGAPTVAPGVTDFGNYAVPSMANLPGYPFAFRAGSLYDEHGNMILDGTPHDWNDCFDKLIWIYQKEDEAKALMRKWSKFIHDTMSSEIVGKQIEKALFDAYQGKTEGKN